MQYLHRDPIQAVRTFLMQERIRDTVITAALSGGADSVCLLYCLLALREECGLTIRALHVQHGLRGEESIRDEQFCRKLAAEWHVELTVVPVDVAGYRREHGGSVEEAARVCRYKAFSECADGFVATAHTASDNFETMLFRLTRGSGLKGLGGIPPVRDRYLRPLLTVTRGEIEQFLLGKEIPCVTDSTNFSPEYTRSYLRQYVVPMLRDVNPALDRTACETAALLRDEEDYLAAQADAAYEQARQPDGSLRGLTLLHPALQRRCVRRFLQEQGLPDGFTQVAAILSLMQKGGRTELNGIWICFSRGHLFAERQINAVETVLKIGENSIFPGHFVRAELILRSDAEKFSNVHKKFTDSVLDYDTIKGYAVLHARKPGLKIRTDGRQHHVSVKKWLNDSCLPARRQTLHFLSDAQGLLWVEGLGTAAHAAVTEQTQTMLLLRVCHNFNT